MPKNTLDAETKQEIRYALAGLSGARAKTEAKRWADDTGLHWSRIYDMTKDLRPPRKARSDKGKRKAPLLTHAGMKTFAELVVTRKLDPDQAIEMTLAQIDAEGNRLYDVPVSLGTARRYLREAGLTKKARRNGVQPHRRFEASAPGEIFQFDISGVKMRWMDFKTRRILNVSPLEVSKNHPNTKSNRVPLWKFVIVDDYSRVRFIKFVACSKPDSEHVITFLLEAFRKLGVPLCLYTDNDAIIVSRRMRRAASILDRAFAESGGFKLDQHLAGNPQATGKVEVSHQIVEKFEKYIGACDVTPTLEQLNQFTERLSEKLNWTVHRVTGQMPAIRFRAGTAAMRVPPDVTLDAAFKSLPLERELRADLTISVDSVIYQLPRGAMIAGERNPFVDWVGKKLEFIWPGESESYFVVLGLKGTIYEGRAWEIDRMVAAPDRAGEFKTPAESVAQSTTKELEASERERKAAFATTKRDADKRFLAGTITAEEHEATLRAISRVVPGIHKDFEMPAAATLLPRKKIATNPELLAALGSDVIPPSMVDGRLIDYYEAATMLMNEELLSKPLTFADQSWLKNIFAGRDTILDTDLRAAAEARSSSPTVREGVA